jgi:hypothetical protein
MNSGAKVLIVLGTLLILGGLLWELGARFGLTPGRLPGDIAIERENVKFYFPITTSIVVSLLLALLSWIFGRPGK